MSLSKRFIDAIESNPDKRAEIAALLRVLRDPDDHWYSSTATEVTLCRIHGVLMFGLRAGSTHDEETLQPADDTLLRYLKELDLTNPPID